MGAANLASGISSGMVVGGSVSKTAVNASAGGNTQLAGLAAAAFTILTLLFLTGLFEDLPDATLAAVVIAAVIELIDVHSLRRYYRLGTGPLRHLSGIAARPDFLAALAALMGVLIFDTLPGLFIGIGVSLLLLLYRASRPQIAVLGKVPGTEDQYSDLERYPENSTTDDVVVLRIEGGLFFANADQIRDRVRAEAARQGVRAVVIDGETSPFIDLTAVRMLDDLTDGLRRDGVRLVLAHEVGRVREVITRAEDEQPQIEIYPTVTDAIDATARQPEPAL
jgi:anti-anti-sigma factor